MKIRTDGGGNGIFVALRPGHFLRFLLLLFFALCCSQEFLSAQSTVGPSQIGQVFRGLTALELTELAAGRAVIRPHAAPRSLALGVENDVSKEIRERFARLSPNYFAEFLLVLPRAGGGLDRLDDLLSDPRHFIGIPYYSKQNETTYQLFDKIEILATESENARTRVTRVEQHMEPFDDYKARYALSRRGSELSFSFENEDPLVYSYRNLRASGPGDMVWTLYAFERDGALWFYGAGGVKAFDLFGVFRSRLEASFMGRIESFFKFVMASLEG